ncbi:hypothetical protein A3Q56_03210, partial [Intoshia linei]
MHPKNVISVIEWTEWRCSTVENIIRIAYRFEKCKYHQSETNNNNDAISKCRYDDEIVFLKRKYKQCEITNELDECFKLCYKPYWGKWSQWSICNKDCFRYRKRKCYRDTINVNENECFFNDSEINYLDTEYCESLTCTKRQIKGGWSNWSKWSLNCHNWKDGLKVIIECGKGFRYRERFCNNPQPSDSSVYCKGNSTETMDCNTKIFCPINGGWSKWTDWICEKSVCGQDVSGYRTRNCNNPTPQYYGEICIGMSIEYTKTECNTKCTIAQAHSLISSKKRLEIFTNLVNNIKNLGVEIKESKYLNYENQHHLKLSCYCDGLNYLKSKFPNGSILWLYNSKPIKKVHGANLNNFMHDKILVGLNSTKINGIYSCLYVYTKIPSMYVYLRIFTFSWHIKTVLSHHRIYKDKYNNKNINFKLVNKVAQLQLKCNIHPLWHILNHTDIIVAWFKNGEKVKNLMLGNIEYGKYTEINVIKDAPHNIIGIWKCAFKLNSSLVHHTIDQWFVTNSIKFEFIPITFIQKNNHMRILNSIRLMAGPVYRKKKKSLPGLKSLKRKKNVLSIKRNMTISELSKLTNRDTRLICEILKIPLSLSTAKMDRIIDIQRICKFCGYATKIEENENKKLETENENEYLNLKTDATKVVDRQPIVTIIGHVNHGKTTLLDSLRNANVAAGEYGGITQHIAAFSVNVESKNKKVTFIDTPGHAAFSVLRKRGIQITDIAVLIVAADDGVMEQTLECIKFVKSEKVPLIVAINKIDRSKSNVEKTKQQLFEHGVIGEVYGGHVQIIEISAKEKTNLNLLLEAILLENDLNPPKTDPTVENAFGYILESRIDPVKGKMTTIILNQGTLKMGDFLISETNSGKIKSIFTDTNQQIDTVGAGIPVQIFGWQDLPNPGYSFHSIDNKTKLKKLLNLRIKKSDHEKSLMDQRDIDAKRELHDKIQKEKRTKLNSMGYHYVSTSNENILNLYNTYIQKNKNFEVKPRVNENCEKFQYNLILYADTKGSLDSILQSLDLYQNDLIDINIVEHHIGKPSTHIIEIAKLFTSDICSFNIPLDSTLLEMSREENIIIKNFNVIYHLNDFLKERMMDIIPDRRECDILGTSKLQMIYNVTFNKKRKLALGCHIDTGQFLFDKIFKITRDGEKIYE